MIWFYYVGFSLLLAVVGPFLLLQKKARAGLTQKLGFVPPYVRNAAQIAGTRRRIWFHAVSVGEFNAILPLLNSLKERHPSVSVFVSTTTATGQKLAKEKVGAWATVFYFPFDLPWALNRWLDAISPHIAVIAETEIWPGFTHECSRRGVKLSCVNGRISPRSFEGYERFTFFFRTVLRNFSAFGVQTTAEAHRYIALGARADVVQVTGNLKFEGIRAVASSEADALREQLRIESEDIVLVAGSTHEQEETALIHVLLKMRENGITFEPRSNHTGSHGVPRLILVPRHPERFERVCQIVEDSGFTARRFSRQEFFTQPNDVYVLDTIGQLGRFYSIADIAFVGGTIARIGGHSLIEPYAYSIPVVCGPHTEKTRDIARNLLSCNAMVQSRDVDELTQAVLKLAKDRTDRQRRGKAGFDYLIASQGALSRTLEMLENLLFGDQMMGMGAKVQAQQPAPATRAKHPAGAETADGVRR